MQLEDIIFSFVISIILHSSRLSEIVIEKKTDAAISPVIWYLVSLIFLKFKRKKKREEKSSCLQMDYHRIWQKRENSFSRWALEIYACWWFKAKCLFIQNGDQKRWRLIVIIMYSKLFSPTYRCTCKTSLEKCTEVFWRFFLNDSIFYVCVCVL